MKSFSNILIYIIPIIGLIAGLSLSITIPLLLLSYLYLIKNELIIKFSNSKLEICCVIWLLISCFMSMDILASLASFFKAISIIIIVYILIYNRDILYKKSNIEHVNLMYILLGTIIIYYFEYCTDGFFNSNFRKLIQNKTDYTFYLFFLDRGCAFLSLFTWVVLAQLLKKNKIITSFFIFILTLITLYLSDSLSAFLGFSLGGIVFFITRFWPFNIPTIISFSLIISSILFLIFIKFTNINKLIDNEAKYLPISAKHRLFIWDFSMKKISKNPFKMVGLNSSRKIDPEHKNFIKYNEIILPLMPLHPHNNLIQITLETGIIGLILYLLLFFKYITKWYTLFRDKQTNNLFRIRSIGYSFFANFFIISMISFNMWQSWWLCSYSLIFLLLSLISYSKN